MRSIKTKLYRWLLLGIAFSIAIFLFAFKLFLDGFYLEKATEEISSSHERFQDDVNKIIHTIAIVSESFSKQSEVIGYTDFIYKYQSIDDYDQVTFDGEKKALLGVLKSFVLSSPVDSVVIFYGDKFNTPIAFSGSAFGNGYLSYSNGEKNYIFEDDGKEGKIFVNSLEKESISQLKRVDIHELNNRVFMDFHIPIYSLSGGEKRRVGTLRAIRFLKGKILENFAKQNSLYMSTKILNQSFSFPKIVISPKNYYIGTKRLELSGNVFDINYGISKEQMLGEYNSLVKATLVIFFLFAGVILPIILSTFNKEVFNPLKDLIAFGKKIKIGKYKNLEKNYNIEFNDVVATLNEMSDSIQGRERELKDTIISLDQYKEAVDESSIVSKGNIEGDITYVNDIFCKMTGYTREELIGKPHSILRDPDVSKEVFKDLWRNIKEKKISWSGYLSNLKKNGEKFYVKLTITPLLDEAGEIVEFIVLRENVTELEEKKKALEHIYTTDGLTALGNRYQLVKDLEENKGLKLVLINIDSFSEINDFYGNSVGDEILIKFSDILYYYFKDFSYYIYRVFGDEFAITSFEDVEKLTLEVNQFLTEILDTSIESNNFRINIRARGGLDDAGKEISISNAEIALKIAKREKRNFVIFNKDNGISKEYENNLLWSRKIKEALFEDRVVPFFQPIRNNKTGKIEKYEALVRIIDDNKIISPFFFLEIAKKSRQYISITKVVIEKTFEYFVNQEEEFSINLSIEDILDNECVEFIKDALNRYNISHRVVFEIVESEEIEDFEKISNFIGMVKSFGCKVAIDDFGTGYSNFEYLMKLNADYLKVDGSLIKNIIEDKNSVYVVETIVEFAKKTGLKTIGEFVSSPEIQEKVEELGIDYSQGYLHGKPEFYIDRK